MAARMALKQRKITDLMQDPDNVRTHSKRNITAIRDSLARFGQVKPIVLVDESTVAAGNGTLVAAAELGWEKVWTVEFDGTVDEARAFSIADNRTAELAGWDYPELLDSLGTLPTDLVTAAGFTSQELDDLMAAWGAPADLDDMDPVGDPFGDGLVRVSFRVSPPVALLWETAIKATGLDADAAAVELIERVFAAVTVAGP